MKKIPVGATIAHAYGFAFGQFPNLLKLVWLPLLIALGFNAVAAPQMMILMQSLRTHDYSALSMPAPLITLFILAAWLFSFMMVTALFQLALGKDGVAGRAWYFSFARPFWRIMGVFFLLIAVMIVLTAIYVLAVALVLFVFRWGLTAAHVSDTSLKGIMVLDGVLAVLAGYCAFLFCWIRFGFLLGATTIAEDRIGLFRSWTLSHRNFWRMFAVTLALFLPFFALEMIGFFELGAWPHFVPGATPDQIKAAQDAANVVMMANMQRYAYVVYPLTMLASLLLYGLMAGASAFAYRTLTQDSNQSRPIS